VSRAQGREHSNPSKIKKYVSNKAVVSSTCSRDETYSLCFFEAKRLNRIPIKANPENKVMTLKDPPTETSPLSARINPTAKLINPHITLRNGDDSPLAGGFANGVGNFSPVTPFVK
jgi:hypothetical protein